MMVLVVLLSVLAFPAAAQEPHEFLKTYGTFSAADLAGVDGGQVVVKVLPSSVKNEVAILGTARVRATSEFFLRMYRDIERFETGWGVTKKLSDPPTIEDFAALELPGEDLKALRDCRIGDCEVKLGEPALKHLQSEVDWSEPSVIEELHQFVRSRAQEYAAGYLEGGNPKLGVYRDSGKPTAVADEFQGLLESSPYVMSYRPELHRYLADFPNATLPGSESFLYWSMVEFGAKPTFRLNHVVIYPRGSGANDNVIIASKQLFFSHYFHTGLELTTLVKDEEHPEDGLYIVALNRYRTDLPGGLFGKMVKKAAEEGAMDSVQRYLRSTQAAINEYFRAERAR